MNTGATKKSRMESSGSEIIRPVVEEQMLPLLPGVKSGTIKHPEGNNQLTSVYFSDKKVGAGVGIRIILLEGSERPFKI